MVIFLPVCHCLMSDLIGRVLTPNCGGVPAKERVLLVVLFSSGVHQFYRKEKPGEEQLFFVQDMSFFAGQIVCVCCQMELSFVFDPGQYVAVQTKMLFPGQDYSVVAVPVGKTVSFRKDIVRNVCPVNGYTVRVSTLRGLQHLYS